MAITSLNQVSERKSRVAVAASKVAQSTQLASIQATRSFTQALLAPLFAATVLTFELVEQQLVLAKELTNILIEPPSKATPVAPNTQLGQPADAAASKAAPKTIDDAAETFAKTADDAATELVTTAEVLAKTADDAIQARVTKADDAAPRRVRTTDEDQELQLRAERLVINKQRVRHGEARVRKEIVTEMRSFDVPVSHEELVIEKYAVTGDDNVDSEPIAAETIRIPLTEEQVNITKETVVRENVEIGKRRVEDVEHITDTVRHEELRVDDATTDITTPRMNFQQLGATPDDGVQAPATTPDDAAPGLVATAQSLAMTADDAIVQALVTPTDDSAPALVSTTNEDAQEVQLRAERLVVNKQRVPNGKARVRKEIVTEAKSIDVPVTHEELVIDRQAVSGDIDANVDSAPIANETISVPLNEDKVNIAKKTVVREEVEIGKRRVEDVEHINDTVRHEELRVDDTTNQFSEPAV